MRIKEAPKNSRHGYLEARPGDVAGRDDLVLIDVRDESELTGDFGHIHGIWHHPMERLLGGDLPGVSAADAIVLVCDNGHRSGRCATELVERGTYDEVYLLVGGMRRWTAEDRPVARVHTWAPLADRSP